MINKNDLITFRDKFLHSDPQSRSVNQLWQEFKQAINKVVLDHATHKVNRLVTQRKR